MQELRKGSDVVVPAFDFGNYQVNKDEKNKNPSSDKGYMMSSFNEIKVKRKKMRDLNTFEGLPGLSEPLNAQQNLDHQADELSQTIREEDKKADTLHLLSPSKKLLYVSLLVLLAICRSSLYPLMAVIPQPIIHKLVWRSLIVRY